jgi:holo-[acyl-carrier protein] synthase
MAMLGLGLDVCSVSRIKKILEGPSGRRFRIRVFTAQEQAYCEVRSDKASAYAARFAAKEALVKALGAPPGITWLDMEVLPARGGPPSFRLSGVAAEALAARRGRAWLALTHDAGVAAATVVLEEAP